MKSKQRQTKRPVRKTAAPRKPVLKFKDIRIGHWKDDDGKLRNNVYGLTLDGQVYCYRHATQCWEKFEDRVQPKRFSMQVTSHDDDFDNDDDFRGCDEDWGN